MIIRNSKGDPIVLNRREQLLANVLTKQANSLGYDVQITTLTQISKQVSEQKFFQVAPADYLPVVVGQGAWSDFITTYRSFDVGADFSTGIINNGGQNAQLAVADAAVDAVNVKTYQWAKQIGWTIIELEQASRSGNWDLISAKERARKRNWDLGIQYLAFLGMSSLNGAGGSCFGLLNQPGVTVNTTLITKAISAMTPAELKTFTAALLEAYRSNCQRTVWPTHFVIPESDYNGLASQASPEFPMKSTLQLLQEMFATITGEKNFKILPVAYADAAYHEGVYGIDGKQVYSLHRYDDESINMNIPVDYTNTLANSINNFQFQNAAYGQFTGVQTLRPLEQLRFQY